MSVYLAKQLFVLYPHGIFVRDNTYSTLLKANGEDIKVVQELLRHANSRITLDIYTQALTPAKREAQSRVANLILPKKTMVGESLTNPFKPSLSEAGSAN